MSLTYSKSLKPRCEMNLEQLWSFGQIRLMTFLVFMICRFISQFAWTLSMTIHVQYGYKHYIQFVFLILKVNYSTAINLKLWMMTVWTLLSLQLLHLFSQLANIYIYMFTRVAILLISDPLHLMFVYINIATVIVN